MRKLLLLSCLFPMSLALAQDWPSRPVQVIVNVAAGGVADVTARIVSAALSESLKQPFVIDNRAGGEGYIGFEAAARAKPDGYSLLFSPGSTMMITPHLMRRADLDPIELFTPVAPGVRTSLLLVVRPGHPAKTLTEFVAYAKASGGKLSYGSAGLGSGLHLAAELFKREAGFQATHVPYKGAGPALRDMMGGVLDFMFDPGTGLSQVKAGKLHLLGVVGSKRHPDFPKVPTFEEAGYPDVTSGPYHSFYVPAGVSPAIVRRLNEEVGKAMARPNVRDKLEGLGLEIGRMPADQFAAYVRAENYRFARMLREFGVTKN